MEETNINKNSEYIVKHGRAIVKYASEKDGR